VTDQIRWGILATGGIAHKFADSLAHVPEATIAAVGSRTLSSAQKFADAHRDSDGAVPRAYGSWAELVADPDVDVIYVATPHSHHHAAGLLTLRAGKPALIEKAFTLDLAQAQDLVTVARERNLFLMEAMWTRTLPAIRKMVELVGDGAIGEVTSVHANFAFFGDVSAEHRLRNRALGGGALLDLGVYPVSFAQLLLGAPTQVRGFASLYPEGTDVNTGIVLGFADGAIATLHCGLRGGIRTASVVGTKGRIDFPHGFHNAQRFTLLRDGAEPVEVVEPLIGNGLNYQAAEVVRCLKAGLIESELVPLSATLDTMRTLDAVRSQIGVHY
jgi:predicted dehydrogenase